MFPARPGCRFPMRFPVAAPHPIKTLFFLVQMRHKAREVPGIVPGVLFSDLTLLDDIPAAAEAESFVQPYR